MNSWALLKERQHMIKKGWEKCGLGAEHCNRDFQVLARREVISRKLLNELPSQEGTLEMDYYDEPIADVDAVEVLQLCLTISKKLYEDDAIFEGENEVENCEIQNESAIGDNQARNISFIFLLFLLKTI